MDEQYKRGQSNRFGKSSRESHQGALTRRNKRVDPMLLRCLDNPRGLEQILEMDPRKSQKMKKIIVWNTDVRMF